MGSKKKIFEYFFIIYRVCRTVNSQGHNLYELKKLSLEPVKIADYFKENNLLAFCLKIVSSGSNLQSLRI